jgi:hypothetical protein
MKDYGGPKIANFPVPRVGEEGSGRWKMEVLLTALPLQVSDLRVFFFLGHTQEPATS